MKTLAQLAFVVLVALGGSVVRAQEPGSDFDVDLPSGWEMTTFVDGAKVKRTEYVFGDRSKALLKVKRLRSERSEGFESLVTGDVEGGLKFQPGFVAGRNERFGGGTLTGSLVEFDFTRGGRPMLGRNYYLQAADGSVWVLQFTGDRTTLGGIRNLTDQIARSFRAKS